MNSTVSKTTAKKDKDMKKLVFAAMAAAMTLGAVSPAAAWTYEHCTEQAQWIDFFVPNSKIAKECHGFMVGQGIVSKGTGEGKTWQELYPDTHWVDAKSEKVRASVDTSSGKLTWTVDKHVPMRTKIIGKNDKADYLDRVNLKLIAGHYKDGAKYYSAVKE